MVASEVKEWNEYLPGRPLALATAGFVGLLLDLCEWIYVSYGFEREKGRGGDSPSLSSSRSSGSVGLPLLLGMFAKREERNVRVTRKYWNVGNKRGSRKIVAFMLLHTWWLYLIAQTPYILLHRRQWRGWLR